MAYILEENDKSKKSLSSFSMSQNSICSALTNYTMVSSVLQVKTFSVLEESSFVKRKASALDLIDLENSEKLLDESNSTEKSSNESIKIISPILTYKEDILTISSFSLD